jgi:hypothetical protein
MLGNLVGRGRVGGGGRGGNWTDLTIFTPSFSPDEKDGGPDTERVVCRLPALSSPLMEPSGPTPPPAPPPPSPGGKNPAFIPRVSKSQTQRSSPVFFF